MQQCNILRDTETGVYMQIRETKRGWKECWMRVELNIYTAFLNLFTLEEPLK
jgi:hypothetical protein